MAFGLADWLDRLARSFGLIIWLDHLIECWRPVYAGTGSGLTPTFLVVMGHVLTYSVLVYRVAYN